MRLGSQQHSGCSRDTSLAETWWVMAHDFWLASPLHSMSLEPGLNKCLSRWPQDLSDIQWREFRRGLPLMVLLFGAVAAVSNPASHQSLNLMAAKVPSADSAAHHCPAADRVSAPCCSCREGFHMAERLSSLRPGSH